jgi:hypothetical protein
MGAGYKIRLGGLTDDELHAMRRGIKEMLKQYRSESRFSSACPLCRWASGGCNACPWWVVAGISCTGYADAWLSENPVPGINKNVHSVVALKWSGNARWKAARIRALARWDRVILAELEERD